MEQEDPHVIFTHTDRGGCKRDGHGGAKVLNGRIYLTPEGGMAVKMTAAEGMAQGEIVYMNLTGVGGQVWKAPVDSDMPIGTVYDASATAGGEVWISTAGIGFAKLTDAVAPTIGNIITTSASARGLGDQAAAIPSVAKHYKEIGHFIESGVAGQPARAILHFN